MTATVTPLRASQPFPPGAYTGAIACAAADITYRRLDYWDKSGVVRPSISAAQGSGTARAYSVEDIVRLAVARVLLNGGLSLAYARRVLPTIEADTFVLWDHLGDEAVRLRVDVQAIREDMLARLEAMAA